MRVFSAMFTKLARRATLNIVEQINAVDRYRRLAKKAHANFRATFEALTKLRQPAEQTVRHAQQLDRSVDGRAAIPCPDSNGCVLRSFSN